MANIGVARASIYADLSATKYEKEAIKATERIAKTRTKSSSGDQVSFSAMEDKLRLDIAAKSGAIRSMTTAQGYLVATMNALDSGDYILKKLHDIAVQASDGNKTTNELSALDVGAEILGDEFHKLITTANYKGKPVFSEANADMRIGTGVKDKSINIGIKQVEYDDLYDHINSPTSSISPGFTYEITKPLTDDQKETILARTSGLNAEQLVVGAQFTVTSQAANGDGAGIHTRDLYYTDGDGSVPFDATSKVSNASSFGGGYLDIEITQNAELSDDFTLVPGNGSSGTITVSSNVVSYVDPIVGSIEIGEIDGTKNGQNGAALRINFYPDATIPGTSNILNGDFSGGGTSWNIFNDRVDFGSTFTVNGRVIPTPSEAVMAQAIKIDEPNNTPSANAVLPGNDNGVLDNSADDIIDYNVTTGAGYLSLNTGDFWFADGHGSAILHGPATVSDVFSATSGDFLKLNYQALGGGDWYHVASYLVDSSGDVTMALNEYGKTTNGWNELSVEVPKTDNYQFVFVNGTWDMSGGKKAGASMLIDNIRAERPYEISETAVQKIMTSTNYSSSSNDQKYIKDVLVKANDGSNTISDSSKIFNTEYDNRLMIAPTLNLEKPVSFGASNNLGAGGTTDPYVVVSKIEEVQTRIGSAKAAAKAHYAVLESAIDSSTDMRAQFFWGADAISDPEFFADTAYSAKQQIMQDNAAAILAQANKSQGGLMNLVDSPSIIEA
jgi:flagellin-like hook-associated protein FlgL